MGVVGYGQVAPDIPFIWVEFECSNGHIHQYFDVHEASIEDMANGLAEAVASCKPEKHNGHGRVHSSDDIKAAFESAVKQMENKDWVFEWHKLHDAIRKYKMWGKHAPEATIFPSAETPGEWIVVEPDPITYEPRFKKVSNPKFLRDVKVDPKLLQKDRYGIGLQVKKKRPRV